MNEQLIKSAKEKGFESKIGIIARLDKIPYRTIKEINDFKNLKYYLWLCELQKWLRDKHGFIAWIECVYHDGFNYVPKYEYIIFDFHETRELSNEWDLRFDKNYDDHEDALEFLLYEAIKLIK